MHVIIDEQQQEHLAGCLKLGRKHWTKIQKDLAAVGVEDDRIDEELEVNKGLRRIFDPEASDAAAHDPAQLDIDDELPSSGETGGGHPAGERVTLNVSTPAAPSTDELVSLLAQADHYLMTAEVEAWTPEQKAEVHAYLGALVAGEVIGERIPDEPSVLESSLTQERVEQLIDAGPWKVNMIEAEGEDLFEVVNVDTKDVDAPAEEEGPGGYTDEIDARVRAARLNRGEIINADISDDDVTKYAELGPWTVEGGESVGYSVACGAQRERCESELEAWKRAARYNRSIAASKDDGWTESAPVKVDENAVQEIRAATEAR